VTDQNYSPQEIKGILVKNGG